MHTCVCEMLFILSCAWTVKTLREKFAYELGEITPSGELFLYVDDSLKLTCTLRDTSIAYNDSLTFKRGSRHTALPQDNLHYYGNSTVILELPRLSWNDSSTYFCFLGQRLVGLPTTVKVDYFPVAPDNVSCAVNERQTEMRCTWREPVTYRWSDDVKENVTYRLAVSGGISPEEGTERLCPEPGKHSCRWSKAFLSRSFLYVTVTVTNSRGASGSKSTLVDPQDHVKCDPVTSFEVVEVNSTCAKVTWDASVRPASSDMLKVFELTYATAEPGVSNKRTLRVDNDTSAVCGLSPFTNYTFNISCQLHHHRRRHRNALWSSPTSIGLKTALDYPEPPAACTACFVIGDMGKTTLFWKPPSRGDRHGALEGYLVRVSDGRAIETNSAATFLEVDSLEVNDVYTFEIYSKNQLGLSTHSARIVRSAKSAWLTNAIDLHLNVTSSDDVILRWKAREVPGTGFNATAVWCTKAVQSVEGCGCQGTLQWREAEGTKEGQITLPGTPRTTLYGLALTSPNHVTSGIHWEGCHRSAENLYKPHFDARHPILLTILILLCVIAAAVGLLVLTVHACRSYCSSLQVSFPENTHSHPSASQECSRAADQDCPFLPVKEDSAGSDDDTPRDIPNGYGRMPGNVEAADYIVQNSNTSPHSSGYIVQNSNTSPHSSGYIMQNSNTSPHSSGYIMQNSNTSPHSSGYIMQNSNTSPHSSDVWQNSSASPQSCRYALKIQPVTNLSSDYFSNRNGGYPLYKESSC